MGDKKTSSNHAWETKKMVLIRHETQNKSFNQPWEAKKLCFNQAWEAKKTWFQSGVGSKKKSFNQAWEAKNKRF